VFCAGIQIGGTVDRARARYENYADMNASGNNTVPSINDYDYAVRPETYIVPALFALIFVIGTIGNGTLVLIFVRHKQMRNVPNIYILNLALGDLLVIISCVPFTSTVYTVIITL